MQAPCPVPVYAPRPREKLETLGEVALDDAELLALLLRTGRPGLPVLELARRLLLRRGGLPGLFAADLGSLREAGLGRVQALTLLAAVSLARRWSGSEVVRGQRLDDPAKLARLVRARLRDRGEERFLMVYLDNQLRCLDVEEYGRGTLDQVSVHPREVVRRAIARQAAALVVAHNHPSGVAEPSAADLVLTERLRQALATIDVRLLDHLIVGDGPPVSLRARGQM